MMKFEPMPKPAEREPRNDVERIGREHARMMDYVREELGDEEHERGPLERACPRKFDPQEYADMAFLPDLYAIEPAVLDDLDEAKAGGDEVRIEQLRHYIRAMSWATHGRTDDKVAAELAQQFLRETQGETASGGRESRAQTGFDYANPDIAEWTRVLNTVNEIQCRGSMVAKPTNFVEKKIVEGWKELIGHMKQKQRKSDWPTTYPVKQDPPVLSDDVRRVSDRLAKLRQMRDQLYYQLLYPKHCMYAQQSKIK